MMRKSAMAALVTMTTMIGGAAVDLGEYNTVIHPGNIKGEGFWNVKSHWFMYAPAFNFKWVEGAKSYRYTVTSSKSGRLTFTETNPKASLARVWAALPVSQITVTCEGVDAAGKVLGKAGERSFWKMPGFDPEFSPKPDRDLNAAAKALYANIFNRKETKYLLENGKFDLSDVINSYASKNGSAIIGAMVDYAEIEPAKRDQALLIARKAAEYLISLSEKPGTPLEYFPPTYAGPGERTVGKDNAGRIMTIYPARVCSAYLKLAKASGESRYRDYAIKIGETFLKLQGEDGTWDLMLNTKDGKPYKPNRLLPIGSVIEALEALYEATGRVEFRQAADRAFAYIDKTRMVDWNWEGQFEDVPPTEPYQNLTKHGAGSFAIYLGKRFPGDKRRIEQMRELARFCEDQFVCWKRPFDGANRDFCCDGETTKVQNFSRWLTPCALEQYKCYWPIDASATKMIKIYLALYRAEGKLVDLMKARALASSILKSQRPDGSIPTWWWGWDGKKCNGGRDWQNCMIASAGVLKELAEAEKWYPANQHKVERRRTPVMGWSSWNSFSCNIDKAKIKSQADALVSLGLRDLGWTYVNIDDCYQNGRDEQTGRLRIDLKKFPAGEEDMKYLADYCHSLGLKAGIYSDGGDNSCSSYNKKPEGLNVGLYRHEREDLEMFMGDGPGCWGYDFIKIDWCGGGHAKLHDAEQYNKIMDVIDDIEYRTGKDKIINICRWAYAGPWQFRADSWRSGPDIDMRGSWESTMVQVDLMKNIAQYTRPSSMNDPDMLVVGQGMNADEDKSHFAMWCMFSSPMLIGQDITKIKPESLALYKNTELIAINQDPAVLSATYVGDVASGVEVWVKMLGCDRSKVRALALLNRNAFASTVTLDYRSIGYDGKVRARDLFAHEDLAVATARTVTLPPHGIDVLKLEPDVGTRVYVPKANLGNATTGRGQLCEESRRIDWVNAMRMMVQAGAKLIDVRSAEEFAAGHVEGAVNMPRETVVSQIKAAVADTNAAIVCYCRQYKRAAQATMLLDLAGYRNVWFVGDGYNDYQAASRVQLDAAKMFISDIKEGKVANFKDKVWFKWHLPWPVACGKADVSWGGKPIVIAGRQYAKGVGNLIKNTGNPSLVQCAIPEGATHFVAMVGIDDNSPVREGKVTFEVHADSTQILVSPELAYGQDYLISTKLPAGAKYVKLFSKGAVGAHTSWGGAGFVLEDKQP